MGMSAGQARLLTITQRLNDNERQAQSITNAKMRLSDSTARVGEEYLEALNATQLNYTTYDSEGNKISQKLTAAMLTQYSELKTQYVIVNSYGQAMVSEADAGNFENSNSLEEFLQNYDTDDSSAKNWYTNLWYRMNGNNDTKSPASEQSWTVLSDADLNSTKWIQYALQNGTVTLEVAQYAETSDDENAVDNIEWKSVIYTSALDIVETDADDSTLAKAEAEYNYALQQIQAKDKEYDNELKALDTEHTALETEYDSVKQTIEKNVERSFKAFS